MDLEDSSKNERDSALLSWIQQFAPYGVFTLDNSLRVQSWNRWMELHSALTFAEVVGRPILEIYPDLVTRRLNKPFQRALDGESSILSTALHHYLLPLATPGSGKKERMLQTARVAPLLTDQNFNGVIVVIEDVSQREAQAESLSRQYRREEVLSWALVQLLKSDEPRKTVRQLFFKIAEHLDFDTFFLYLRDEKSDLVRLYTAGGIPDESEALFLDYGLLVDVAKVEKTIIFNDVQNQPDGKFKLLREAKISSAVAIPLLVNEEILGALCFASWNREEIATDECVLLTTIAQYLATAIDKENTKRELQVVEATRQWMAAIVDSSDDAIIGKDLNGIIKSCNNGAARLFGYEIDELIGKPMRMLIPKSHQNEEEQILDRIRAGERLEHFETLRQRKDGSLISVSLMISPVIDNSGKVIGASNIARDVTERKANEEKLFRASRAKDDFLAALSHELRTPLNPALLVASECADNPELPEAVRSNFDIIRKNIELEASLIDDLLDLTRITAGKMILNKSRLDVHVVLTDALATTQADLQDKKIHLDIRLNATPSVVEGDVVRLQQVFWNILKNAVKFTPVHGKIVLQTLINQDGRLIVQITDTGIGMNPAEVQRIFTAFTQGDHGGEGGSHRFGGLGLGLAISKNLVELHSGTISAQSDGRDKGSAFTVELPLASEVKNLASPFSNLALQVVPKTSAVESASLSILLVEDHEITRTVLTQLLTRRNYHVLVANSVAMARDIAANSKFDILISDIGLPDGNGNQLMEEMRERFGVKGIALTGYGMEEDIERGKLAGFVTHLIKPVKIQALENALSLIKITR